MGKVHDEPGRRWHQPALPTTLARLLLRGQARRKACASAQSERGATAKQSANLRYLVQ
jgi:hypothetical protein